jgi:hypothetical protein
VREKFQLDASLAKPSSRTGTAILWFLAFLVLIIVVLMASPFVDILVSTQFDTWDVCSIIGLMELSFRV